ncbi:hypothetical protein SAMN05421858_4775 [Haladaptatus litoreus]|uniref:Uncharacterized protein n=1 Tax=Haladaptatus litoreus TaxID=553468 RepID=A0A1N7F3K7_9EURY|nr:hypothetical protein [Haladaptatus litoreus]SIR94937.1 hypothetical protein SAMN05421858_4775 [Haladaptatus litoreus]
MVEDSDANSMADSLQRQAQSLQETSPAKYGLLKAYHERVRDALEVCSRNYPSTKQLSENLPDSSLTPQMLGNLLALLVQFEIIEVFSERNNSNRYDLTHYDRKRMDTLSHILQRVSAGS